MQSRSTERHTPELPEQLLDAVSGLIERHEGERHDEPGAATPAVTSSDPFPFEGHYVGQMIMLADAATVSRYLDAHQGWFRRCAHPMTADPLGETGYAITVGRFGALDFEVEPKIGLDLLPQDQGVYRIRTLAVPGYEPDCYMVDFNAEMHLQESSEPDENGHIFTQVKWELHLAVWINFPRFIQVLPRSLVKTSGDRLLNQIVRQVSRRLTRKVQEDFHTSLGLPLPKLEKRHFWQR
ncbi:MAG: DUF1997 domain-containing protein [Cyanobacteria bacterium P01_C01_bin.73]